MAWGALAFGAVYPWAYWPLLILCSMAGIAGLAVSTRRHSVPAILLVAIATVAAAIMVQLIPLPISTIASISPRSLTLLQAYDPRVATGFATRHALSVAPSATATSLAILASLVLLMVGISRVLSVTGSRRLVESITVLGVIVALVGIVQKPLYTGEIYGFWQTRMGGDPFGPFVNKNHFAGWMLMALPLGLGLLLAGVSHSVRRVRPDWRSRLLWLGSPDASRLILLAAAVFLMTLSLVLTMSRSGISALALSLVITGWFVARNQGNSRGPITFGFLLLLVVVVVSWVGADAIVSRFSVLDWREFNDRRGAWLDAWAIASAFPLTGTGVNTYSVATLFYQTHGLDLHYAQAHNDYLQLLAEGGLLIAIPVVGSIAALTVEIWRRARETERDSTTYWLRAGAITAIVAIALQECVDFSLQMPGNAVLFAVVCAIALHRPPRPR